MNAKDVADIATAEQTITCNRYTATPVYHWNQYSINTYYTGQLEQIADVGTMTLTVRTTTATASGMRHTYAYGFSGYQVSTSTGVITLSSQIIASYTFVPSGSNSWRADHRATEYVFYYRSIVWDK